MGYSFAEINEAFERAEALEDQVRDLETEVVELKAERNELRAQLGYLRNTRTELGTPVIQSRDGWVERYENGEWVRDHEVEA